MSCAQPRNWDSKPDKKLTLPCEEFLKRTEAVMGMLKLQKTELDIISISDTVPKGPKQQNNLESSLPEQGPLCHHQTPFG